MKSYRSLVPLLACAIMPGCAPAERPAATSAVSTRASVDAAEERDLSRFFDRAGVEGTFVLYDPQTADTLRHNPERARVRYSPASTYKIPNTLIALESGVASGAAFRLSRDNAIAPRQPWWPQIWLQDHTLRTALANSVVWYYQELARRIGAERMQAYLDRFDYGNRNVSGGIDTFWLTGALRISADEQIDFLRRFHSGELGVSEATTQIAKDLLILEETPEYRLSGKTGWAGLEEDSAEQVGWLVGYLERDEEVYFFAINIDIEESSDAATRLPISKAILRNLGLLEP